MTDVEEPPAATITGRSARQTAGAAVLVGIGAEAAGLVGLRLGVLLAEALCGPDCGLGMFALAIPVVMPLMLLGTATGAGLVAALLARRTGRTPIEAGLPAATGTAVALPATIVALSFMESVMPLEDKILFALPFLAGSVGYLIGLWWSNRRQG